LQQQAVTKIKLNTPNIPIVSTVTGLKLDEEAVSPQYATRNTKICLPTTLLELDNPIFLKWVPDEP
jgi:acyl transferase domain-containing protein